jgi:hypothetical protein
VLQVLVPPPPRLGAGDTRNAAPGNVRVTHGRRPGVFLEQASPAVSEAGTLYLERRAIFSPLHLAVGAVLLAVAAPTASRTRYRT